MKKVNLSKKEKRPWNKTTENEIVPRASAKSPDPCRFQHFLKPSKKLDTRGLQTRAQLGIEQNPCRVLVQAKNAKGYSLYEYPCSTAMFHGKFVPRKVFHARLFHGIVPRSK